MKNRLYLSKKAVVLLTADGGYYKIGEAFLDGGVRPKTFNNRKEAFRYLKQQKCKLLHTLESEGSSK